MVAGALSRPRVMGTAPPPSGANLRRGEGIDRTAATSRRRSPPPLIRGSFRFTRGLRYNAHMRLRQILIVIGFLGIGLFLIANLGDFHKFVEALSDVQWYLFPLLIAIQLYSFYCSAHYYQIFFAAAGNTVGLRRMYEISMAINFTNQVVPAGGLAGVAYLNEVVKPEVPSGTATLAQLAHYVFTFISYFVVLGLGLTLLFLSGDLNKVSVRIMLIVMVATLLAGVVILMVFSERSRTEAVLRPVLGALTAIKKSVFRRPRPIIDPAKLAKFLDDFYHGYHEIIKRRETWPKLLAWCLGGNFAEVATLYAVFIGFGLWPNPGVVITGYTLAIMISVLGVFTGGVGFYEFGMIGTLSALGIPFATAFAVVIVYRGLSMLLFLPPGFYFYRKTLEGR